MSHLSRSGGSPSNPPRVLHLRSRAVTYRRPTPLVNTSHDGNSQESSSHSSATYNPSSSSSNQQPSPTSDDSTLARDLRFIDWNTARVGLSRMRAGYARPQHLPQFALTLDELRWLDAEVYGPSSPTNPTQHGITYSRERLRELFPEAGAQWDAEAAAQQDQDPSPESSPDLDNESVFIRDIRRQLAEYRENRARRSSSPEYPNYPPQQDLAPVALHQINDGDPDSDDDFAIARQAARRQREQRRIHQQRMARRAVRLAENRVREQMEAAEERAHAEREAAAAAAAAAAQQAAYDAEIDRLRTELSDLDTAMMRAYQQGDMPLVDSLRQEAHTRATRLTFLLNPWQPARTRAELQAIGLAEHEMDAYAVDAETRAQSRADAWAEQPLLSLLRSDEESVRTLEIFWVARQVQLRHMVADARAVLMSDLEIGMTSRDVDDLERILEDETRLMNEDDEDALYQIGVRQHFVDAILAARQARTG